MKLGAKETFRCTTHYVLFWQEIFYYQCFWKKKKCSKQEKISGVTQNREYCSRKLRVISLWAITQHQYLIICKAIYLSSINIFKKITTKLKIQLLQKKRKEFSCLQVSFHFKHFCYSFASVSYEMKAFSASLSKSCFSKYTFYFS